MSARTKIQSGSNSIAVEAHGDRVVVTIAWIGGAACVVLTADQTDELFRGIAAARVEISKEPPR